MLSRTLELLRVNPGFRRVREQTKLIKRHRVREAKLPYKQQGAAIREGRSSRTGDVPMLNPTEFYKREVRLNRTYAMQMAGDKNQLSAEANFGVRPVDILAHGDKVDEMIEPPPSFTPLMSRKLAEGRLWPQSPFHSNLTTAKEGLKLANYENLFASEKKAADVIVYWLRRNLRAAPAHIVENIDLVEFVLHHVVPRRTRKHLYIMWTTVHPEARFKIEPHVNKLVPWVYRMLKERCSKSGLAFLPREVFFVYMHDNMVEDMPLSLTRELEARHADLGVTLTDRVARLKALDSVEARMKGVPWFMPYLWAKDEKLRNTKQSLSDLEAVEQRQKEARAASAKGPKYTV